MSAFEWPKLGRGRAVAIERDRRDVVVPFEPEPLAPDQAAHVFLEPRTARERGFVASFFRGLR